MAALTVNPGSSPISKLTMSTWFRIKTADLPAHTAWGCLMSIEPTIFWDGVSLELGYNPANNKWDVLMQFSTEQLVTYTTGGSTYHPEADWYTAFPLNGTLTLPANAWHMLLCSFDVSLSGPGNKRGWIYVDGVSVAVGGGTPNFFSPPAPSGERDLVGTGESDNGTSCPSFSSRVDTIGFPDLTDVSLLSVPRMQRADTQIWLDKYIDLSDPTNRAKFYKISGTTGIPVSPETAAAAFGTQTYLFKGKSSTFSHNAGSGGAAIVTGTIADFSPGPSFAT